MTVSPQFAAADADQRPTNEVVAPLRTSTLPYSVGGAAVRALTFVDLFCGIGGFHQALRADPGFDEDCVFACDIDPTCRAVYETNFQYRAAGDILQVTSTDSILDEAIKPHDLLCAGFPCQPFSKSGHQRGIEEARGTLFHEICRVLARRTPSFVLLENVRNLAGPRHRSTWATIVRLLREIGYAVSSNPVVLSPHRLPSGLGGLPQARERVFVPAVFVGRERAEQLCDLPPLVARQPVTHDPSTWDLAEILESDVRGELPLDQIVAIDRWAELLQDVRGDVPGFAVWMDVLAGRLRQDASFPAWKNQIIRANDRFVDGHRPAIRRWISRYSALEDLPASYRKFEWQARGHALDLWQHSIQFRPSGIRVRPLTYLPALVAINQAPVIGPLRRRLTVREGLALQGFPPEFEHDPEPKVAFRHLGNAVAVGVVRFLLRAMLSPGTYERSLVAREWLELLEARDVAMETNEPALAAS